MSATSSDLYAYCNGGFLEVSGWGVDRNIVNMFLLIQQFQKGHGIVGPLCEIGVHHGRALVLLALLQRTGEMAVGVDLFELNQDQNIDHSGGGSRTITQDNLSKHAPGARYKLFAENSLALSDAALAAINHARLFHIDGGHTVEITMNDLYIAQSTLAVGGVIVIDDYWNSGWPEVQEGVARYFFTSTTLKALPVMTGNNKLFLAHLSHRDRLFAHLLQHMPVNRNRKVRVFGHTCICVDPFAPGQEWIVQPETD